MVDSSGMLAGSVRKAGVNGKDRRPLCGSRDAECEKDVKINGTNSVKSFRINKSAKKRTQNELVFGRKKRQLRPKINEKCCIQ